MQNYRPCRLQLLMYRMRFRYCKCYNQWLFLIYCQRITKAWLDTRSRDQFVQMVNDYFAESYGPGWHIIVGREYAVQVRYVRCGEILQLCKILCSVKGAVWWCRVRS